VGVSEEPSDVACPVAVGIRLRTWRGPDFCQHQAGHLEPSVAKVESAALRPKKP
jgi:hypothetical protein